MSTTDDEYQVRPAPESAQVDAVDGPNSWGAREERRIAALPPRPGAPAPDTERDERLRGIQERARLASAGPWDSYSVPDEPGDPCHSVVEIGDHEVRLDWLHGSSLDANFIAAARTDVPWLLAEVTRLDAVVTAVRGLHVEIKVPKVPYTACGECFDPYPCPTVRALDGVDT